MQQSHIIISRVQAERTSAILIRVNTHSQKDNNNSKISNDFTALVFTFLTQRTAVLGT